LFVTKTVISYHTVFTVWTISDNIPVFSLVRNKISERKIKAITVAY